MAMAHVLVLRTTADDQVEGSWPAGWLPRVLGEEHEEETVDGTLHRYHGARVLYTAGCRSIDVTASPEDTTALRLTLVWGDVAPPADEREAFLSWWVGASRGGGWDARDVDEVVGEVVVEQYVPTETSLDESGRQVVVHDWVRVVAEQATRTSGRRTIT